MRLSLESCTSLDCLVSCHIGYSCELMFLVACLNTIKLGRRQDQCYLFIHMQVCVSILFCSNGVKHNITNCLFCMYILVIHVHNGHLCSFLCVTTCIWCLQYYAHFMATYTIVMVNSWRGMHLMMRQCLQIIKLPWVWVFISLHGNIGMLPREFGI